MSSMYCPGHGETLPCSQCAANLELRIQGIPSHGKLTEHEARRILDAALELEKTGRMVAITDGQEKTDFMARNRSVESFLRDILKMLTEPTAIDAEVAQLRDALLEGARRAEALKRECGTNPESAIAVQNSRYMGLSTFLRNSRAASL